MKTKKEIKEKLNDFNQWLPIIDPKDPDLKLQCEAAVKILEWVLDVSNPQ